jgi:hypothetical protein
MGLTGGITSNLEPAQKQMTLASNYLSFTDGTNDFAQQYLPELYEAEVERYGNRTIGGFLRMVGAEMPMSSDQVIWSEQNRLHVSYKSAVVDAAPATSITITIDPEVTAAGGAVGNKDLAIKVGQTVVISKAGTGSMKCRVESLGATAGGGAGVARTQVLNVLPYTNADLTTGALGIFGAADAVTVFVYGSEFAKGSDDNGLSSIEPEFTQFNNKPIILRDKYVINGSDAAQIGWVEVATEDGASGYLWYLKAESETRLRFEDYMEMSMVEAVKKSGGGIASHDGSEGLFAAIKDRGNVLQGFGATSAGSGALADFDEVLKGLDKEGAIEENMLFVNRGLALDIDDMLGAVNSGFDKAYGASFGLFNNEAEMALNLGFSGFRRGSYDFYKSDWKYLNDAATRGVLGLRTDLDPAQSNTVEGVLVPAGTSTVYDQLLGQNIRRPFLHVRYRASETEDRRMKSWITGSVGGAYTSSLDAMKVNFLSERCLCVQGANNFVLFTS